jgi:hypothetical protein
VTADGWFGWFLDLEPGQHCMFNFQCATNLVCRPQSEGYWPTDPVCTRRAEENELCDSDDDCYVGLACIGHTRLWENGRCLFPSGKTERHTICNSLLRHMNACEIAAGEKLLDSCLAASDWHKTEEILDLSCARLVALVESGLDFDGDGFITDLGNDRRCFFNFQCSGDLVCRPIEKSYGIYNLADPEDKFCLGLGKEREYCDSTQDCSNGQACMGFTLWGDNGRCLMPEEDESYEKTACRTLRDQLMSCSISVSRSFVASCLVTDHWDAVESYLDMSCQKLETLEIIL